MNKVVVFGEVMLRLATDEHIRFSQANSLQVTYGGGEANVAVSLANFNIETSLVSRFPDNDLNILNMGISASALKHTVIGDMNLASLEEVEKYMIIGH